MSNLHHKAPYSPVIVGICAWIIPGGGYFLLGEKKRAFTVFFSVTLLFLMGILIGGIRIMDPPGWGEYGFKNEMVGRKDLQLRELERIRIEPINPDQEQNPAEPGEIPLGPAILNQPMAELADKPWFVCQILCGPTTLASAAISVDAARPKDFLTPPKEGVGASHSRSWEIGALYTAVAGMLNLLVIIDSAYRASRWGEEDQKRASTAQESPLQTSEIIISDPVVSLDVSKAGLK